MTKQQKDFLLITILLMSLLQMPGQATAPSINKVYMEVFTNRSLSSIQAAFSMASIMAAAGSVVTTILIGRGLLSKRVSAAVGMFLLGSSGIMALTMHTHFWQLVITTSMTGVAVAFFISPMISVMVDTFKGEEGKQAAGLQSTFNGIGGVLLSILAGYIIARVWYGGFLILLAALPIGVLVLLSFPKGKLPRASQTSGVKRTKLHTDVYYYTLFTLLVFFLFIVGSNNISVHISRSGIENYTAAAGYATAFQMGGSIVSGALFKKLTTRLGDMMMPLAFVMQFIGYTMINLLDFSLVFIFLGIFLSGSAVAMMTPQCILSVSKRVDETNSVIATTFLNAIAPGVGAFLSPIVITNLTAALGGDSTNYRFQFAAFAALGLAVLLVFLTRYRAKRQAGMFD